MLLNPDSLCGNYEENYKSEFENGTMINIQGAFSSLLSEFGFHRLFKMLIKDKAGVKANLEMLNFEIAGNIREAANRGTKIISFAEPSAMPSLMGDHNYKEFVADYVISLFRSVENSTGNSLIHICPRCSILLEEYGLVDVAEYCADHRDYIDILKDSDLKFVGHNCMNQKNVEKLYEIRLR